jgi:hypothetical protein
LNFVAFSNFVALCISCKMRILHVEEGKCIQKLQETHYVRFKSETTPSSQTVSRTPPRPNFLPKSSLTWLRGMLTSTLRPFPAKPRGVAHYTFCACFRVTPFLSMVLATRRHGTRHKGRKPSVYVGRERQTERERDTERDRERDRELWAAIGWAHLG